jgi:DNA-binding MarR family transcriptional regulator
LAIDKSRSRAPGKFQLEFNPETGGWDFIGEAGADNQIHEPDCTEERILAFFDQNRNTPYEVSELFTLLGGGESTLRKALTKLAQSGRLSRRKSNVNTRAYVYWLGMAGGNCSRTAHETNCSPSAHELLAPHEHLEAQSQQGIQPNCSNAHDVLHFFSDQPAEKNENFDEQMSSSHETQSESGIPTARVNCSPTAHAEYCEQLSKDGTLKDLPKDESRRPPVLKRGMIALDQDYQGYWLDSFHKNVWWAYRKGEEFVELRPEQIVAIWEVTE